MDTVIEKILEPSEKVKWRGIIARRVLTFELILGMFIFIIGGIVAIALGKILIGILIIFVGLLLDGIKYYADIIKRYAITNKRIIFQSGIIGTDFKSIYYDQIKNVVVDIFIIGKIFNVGTVKIDTGKTQTYATGSTKIGKINIPHTKTRIVHDLLKHIDKPYEVYRFLQASLSSRKESLYSGRADRETQEHK